MLNKLNDAYPWLLSEQVELDFKPKFNEVWRSFSRWPKFNKDNNIVIEVDCSDKILDLLKSGHLDSIGLRDLIAKSRKVSIYKN